MSCILYLDTEFSSFEDMELLSLGLVHADSDKELYVVIADPDPACRPSGFVIHEVFKLIGLHDPEVLTREQCAHRIDAFIADCRGSPDKPVLILADAAIDWQLLIELWPPMPGQQTWASANNIRGAYLCDQVQPQQQVLLDEFVEEFHAIHDQRHHALMDARALKYAHKKVSWSHK